jgi:hypothetical protein
VLFRLCAVVSIPAVDENGIFGGDEWAMKAAAHELKGLSQYMMLSIKKKIAGLRTLSLSRLVWCLGRNILCDHTDKTSHTHTQRARRLSSDGAGELPRMATGGVVCVADR